MNAHGKSLGSGAASMSAPDVFRQYLMRSAIAAGIACGAWFFVGRNIERGAIAAEQEKRAAEERLAAFDQQAAMEPDYEAVILDAEARRAALTAWSKKGVQAGSPYDTFRAIAAAGKVRLQRIEPWSKGGKNTAYLGADRNGGMIETVGYALEICGSYHDAAMFVDALEHTLGASTVETFRFVPFVRAAGLAAAPGSAENPEVTAVVEVAHMDINIVGTTDKPPVKGETP